MRTRRPAVIVPDTMSWLLWGHDVADQGLAPAATPERAEVLLGPALLPEALLEATREAWSRMPAPSLELLDGAPVAGVALTREELDEDTGPHGSAHEGHGRGGHDHGGHGRQGDGGHGHELHGDGAHEHGDHDDEGHGTGEHGHGGHDHHDMMAIVGDPSDDGLIMESIDVILGPFAPALPGGLVAELSLDGDVVEEATVRGTLAARPPGRHDPGQPDALTPLTWRVVTGAAHRPSPHLRSVDVVAVEAERALSHAAWLTLLAHALGWGELGDRARRLARSLLPVRGWASAALDGAGGSRQGPAWLPEISAVEEQALSVDRLLHGRAARRRLSGLARIGRDDVQVRQIGGPMARAVGVRRDARQASEPYSTLGFEPALAEEGDALARAKVRVAELAASLRLVAGAARAGDDLTHAPAGPAVVEGPRGPVHAIAAPDGSGVVAAPGRSATFAVAGAALTGLELGPATVALTSFDLSPWELPG